MEVMGGGKGKIEVGVSEFEEGRGGERYPGC